MSMRLRIGQREDIKITPPEVGTIHYRLSKFKSFVALAGLEIEAVNLKRF
jgi:hypothetical protein